LSVYSHLITPSLPLAVFRLGECARLWLSIYSHWVVKFCADSIRVKQM